MGRRDEIIVGLDVGTTKVAAVVGEVREDGSVDVIGVGMTASHGIKKGVVVHADETTEAIRRAIHEAELMAGCEIHSVFAGIFFGAVIQLSCNFFIRAEADLLMHFQRLPAKAATIRTAPRCFDKWHQRLFEEFVEQSGQIGARNHIE